MTRRSTFFKKRSKVFSGKRNPGGKTVIQVVITETNNVAQVQNIGSSEPSASPPEPKKESTSRKKISSNLDRYDQYTGSCAFDGDSNDIVNFGNLEMLLSQIGVCKKCKGSISFVTSNRQGLSVKVSIRCNNCKYTVSDYNSSKIENGKSEINVRLAYAFRSIGKAEQAAKTVCAIMNLPKPPAFKYYTEILSEAAKEVCLESMKKAAQETIVINNGNTDITAIFDGSWQKRGHSSPNGIVSAISAENGKVIDIRILSKYCRCKRRLEQVHEANCIANYEGGSGGMEVQGVMDMFQNSVGLHGMRYKYYLGDGDSSAFSTVEKAKPYGDDFNIEKKECIGHVQKRMGSRLRKMKKTFGKTKLSDGKPIGGKGRLTYAAINDMQLFYGLAIRRNWSISVQAMKSAIWAEFFHLKSTNEEPAHALCPKTPDTWCKYQQAALNREEYNHEDHNHVDAVVMEEIKQTFTDLTDPALLAKCLHGGTQNPSESLNNVIWSRIPKATFVMRNTLELGTYDAVATYNEGNIAKCQILQKLGIKPGTNLVQVMKKFDEVRIKKADKAIEEIEIKCRQKQTAAKRRLEDQYEANEDPDNPTYGPGMH